MSDRLNRLFAVGCVTRKAQLAEIRGFLVLSLPALRLIGETLGTLPLSLRKQFLRFGAAGSISRFGEGGHCVTVFGRIVSDELLGPRGKRLSKTIEEQIWRRPSQIQYGRVRHGHYKCFCG
jgi:hypothetical protein